MARLASSLPELPATATALAAGRLSEEAADAVVHAARDGRLGTPDEVETRLLPIATTEGPEQVRAEVRRRTQQADAASMLVDETRQHARRTVSLTPRDDGTWQLHGRSPSEAGNALATAVDVALSCADLPATGGVARPHISAMVDLATLQAAMPACRAS